MNLPDLPGQLWNSIQGVNWATPTWDLVLIMFVVIGAVVYGISLGRDRNIAILFSIYIAIAIVSFAPYISAAAAQARFNNQFAFQVTTFVGIFAFLFFLFSRSAVLKAVGGGPRDESIFQVVAFSILHVGLLTSVVLSYLPSAALSVFSEPIKNFFVHDLAKFIWITAPVVVMGITGGRKKDE